MVPTPARLVPLLLLGTACAAPSWQAAPHDRPFQRVPAPRLHPPPATNDTVEIWYAIHQSAARPLATSLNPGHYVEMIVGEPPALDVNHFGQVIDSTWFTNRIGRRPLSLDEVRTGPNLTGGPAPGAFLVIGGKVKGATPGLVIRDQSGAEFIVKFDPPAFPGLTSGAELIATKILWAAGYNVPENYVMTFDLSRLVLDPKATTVGKLGERIKLTQKRLDDLIALVNPYPDGTIRALFSRRLPGRLLGPFRYRGQRSDDPNDNMPHERRRSLRGLWLLSAWINNTDTRSANSMDVFVPVEGNERGYVRHYLIDFGDALGATSTQPKFPGQGYEYLIDWPLIGRELFSLGLAYRYWLPLQRSPYRSVGLFESQIFRPERWRPNLPNPAFDDADVLDTYWAASIIARFTPAHLRAIVDEAGYTEPGARQWVLRVLLARQSQVLQYAFQGLTALDGPVVDGLTLSMTDLAAVGSVLLAPFEVRYEWIARRFEGREVLDRGVNGTPVANLETAVGRMRERRGAPFMTVEWRRLEADQRTPAVRVHLRVVPEGIVPVALERDVER